MIVFENATTLKFEPPSVQHGMDLVIKENRIKAVGQNIAKDYPDARHIPLDGNIVFPGLVCSHNHFYSGLARGLMAKIGPTPDFVSILKNIWWRLDRALDEESLYYSGLICALDAIKCGTTAVIDHHASPSFIRGSLHTLKQAFEKTGLRGITCYEVTDRNGLDQMADGITENIDFAELVNDERKQSDKPYLVEAMIGAHAPFTLPDNGLLKLADAVAATNRGFHIHVAEDAYDVTHSHAVYDKDVVDRLRDFGLLNKKGIMVHGLFLSNSDRDTINDCDCFLVHNPRSNMNNSVGYNEKLSTYENIAIGTDGIGSNMFEELKVAFFKHKDNQGVLNPGDFLRFLWNGNRLLERNFSAPFGRLEPGNVADLVVSDYISPTPLVAENIAGHMIFGMGAENVKTVMINGRIVYEDRCFPINVQTLYSEAQKQAQRLWARMDELK